MKVSKQPNIIITGAAGFIGSCMVRFLNEKGYQSLILVDDFSVEKKKQNWQNKAYKEIIDRNSLFTWLTNSENKIDIIIHLGARTDTTEFDYAVHEKLNVEYSKKIWNYCAEKNIPLIYASSAATYGGGELGYSDDHDIVNELKPLNPYGVSKNEFDKWALGQQGRPYLWAGLKFFNIYGPNEYHKGRMASVIWHAFNQIKKEGFVKLFRSHRSDFDDGEQLRDFVYVMDLLKVMTWMMKKMLNSTWNSDDNGLYNLGTGKARSFRDLTTATFNGLGLQSNVVFIDMPVDIRDKYQYFTEANMEKLQKAGYNEEFYTLEAGISEYVEKYLNENKYY
jgi:ADP-L-glycero-D-manno-heptose 6-epimerase